MSAMICLVIFLIQEIEEHRLVTEKGRSHASYHNVDGNPERNQETSLKLDASTKGSQPE